MQSPQPSITLAGSCKTCHRRGRRANLCQPSRGHISEQTQLGNCSAVLLDSGPQLPTPFPLVPLCRAELFVPFTNICTPTAAWPIAHSVPVHRGLTCAQLYVYMKGLSALLCSNSRSTCALSSQPTWTSGYWALLTHVICHPDSLETQIPISTQFSEVLIAISCKRTASLS